MNNIALKSTYPLSSPQREIWFDQLLHPEIPLYNIGGYVKIHGVIDPILFERAVNLLVQKHDVLRTVLITDQEGVHTQAFLEKLEITVSVQDFSAQANSHELAMTWMQNRFVEPFELTGQPLFRYDLIKLSVNEYCWLAQYHHLITDGYSIALLNRSLANLYTQLVHGQIPDLKSPSYVDFIEHDRNDFTSENFEKKRQYWLKKYASIPEPLLKPRSLSHENVSFLGSQCETLSLPRDFYQHLHTFALSYGVTFFRVVLSAFYVYFTRTTQRNDFAVGFPILNRPHDPFKIMAGHCTLVNPAWFQYGQDLSVVELLQHIDQAIKEDFRHQPFPVHEINRMVKQKQGQLRSILFDLAISYQKFDYESYFNGSKTQTTWLFNHWEQTPLVIYIQDFHAQGDVKFDFVYNVAYFTTDEIKMLQHRLVTILKAILEQADTPIHSLPIMTVQETQQLLAWNQTKSSYLHHQTIVDVFQAQVEKTPEAIAVVFEGQHLTYRELNQRANQLAHYLLTFQLKPETPIGLYLERSLEMMVGILGILKAGGVYVPLSPTYPKERIAALLVDSKMPVLLTQETFKIQFLEFAIQILCLDTQWDEIAKNSCENSCMRIQPEHLSYIIYTSGTTGKPKGVMIEHHSVLNLLEGLHQAIYSHYPQTPLRISLNGPLAFDTSIKQIIQLLAGHTVDILPEKIRLEGKALLSYLQEHKIEVFDCTPSQLKILISEGLLSSSEVPLCVLVGGELIDSPLWKNLSHTQHIRFYNLYGPSECTVDATISLIHENTVPTIGRPITNTQIYLLDTYLQLVPIGVPGELHIGGAGLARGYLNYPDLTAEKFIPNPFSDDSSARLYKTGDLARYLPDGNLEYLGRIDTQVKLRGFRIELGEIEATLLQHSAISEAVAIVREDIPGDKRLVGYVVLHSEMNGTSNQLRQFLKEKLPEYMVPSVIVLLKHLPLTPNGKIDRRALPKPEYIETEETFVAPRNEIELQLQKIWEDILQVRPIGVTQNFFELGGHSLLAVRLISRIRSTLDIELPLRTLFENPTISNLVTHLKILQHLHLPPIQLIDRKENIPLSFAQQRLWFLDQLEGTSSTYNLPLVLHLHGPLNSTALQKSLVEIIQRHESLRTTFLNLQGTPYQVIHPLTALWTRQQVLSVIEQPQLDPESLLQEEAQCPFDLEKGPLFRATLYVLGHEENLFLIVMHHIISDGWSIKNFTEELTRLYETFAQELPPHLPPLPLQYADFAHWQRQWFTGEILDAQLTYWKKQLENIPHLLSLPTDFPRPLKQSFQGATLRLQLPMRLSKQLNELSLHNECTLFMTLLSAFATLLFRHSGMHDLIIGTAIANRRLSETESLIGFFINTLALRIKLENNPPFDELLKQVKQTALEAYTHGDLPFEKLVEELNPERDLSHTPIFQVMVVLENMPKSTFQLGDLKISSFPLESQTTKFDLNFHWSENDEGLLCTLWYNTDLFKTQTIQCLLGHFETLLEDIVTHPHQRLSQLRLLTEAEQCDFSTATHTVYPSVPFVEFPRGEESITARFEQQIQRDPLHLAIKTKRYSWTYQELGERVESLASFLLSQPSGERIALLFEHDAPMIVAILAVLKAGKLYVPLDPTYPQTRLTYLVQDSQATSLLTSQENQPLAHTLVDHSTFPIIVLDFLTTIPSPMHWPKVEGKNLAYILYTSGSTGQPKGVIQNHRNVLHFIRCYTNNLHIHARDRLTLLASYSFDAAVMDIFAALLNGATLCLFNLREEERLASWLREEQVTIYHSTPTVYRYFLQTLVNGEQFPSIRLVVLGGESTERRDVEGYRQHFGKDCFFVNGLGPTESTVTLQYLVTHYTNMDRPLVPIGYPVEETEIWLLDEQGERTEWYGEIGVRSAYLALGYWRQEELTQKVFLADPEGGERRIYRTGDLARRLMDGSFEFLGRRDFQVKIRGVRIELGEIESVLLTHPSVREGVVVAREEKMGEKRLVAYVVLHQAMTFLQMREFLKERLPEFMLPSALVVLEALPLTSTGKVNRLALPKPEALVETAEIFVAPRNDIELQLQRIWEEVLQVHPIGVTQNFFELGGHSLLAIRLLAEIKKIFKHGLPVLTIFQKPTIEQLANHLSHQTGEDSPSHTLIFIQPQGYQPPLFFIGSTNLGQLLATQLGKHQPVYGLNVFGLMGINKIGVPLRIHKIARQFVQEVQNLQPHGPYYFCGYCADARIAFEMAQQLNQLGEEIAFLGFIDVLWQKHDRYARLRRNLLKFGFFSYLIQIFKRKLKYRVSRLKFKWNRQKMRWYHLRRIPYPLEVQQTEFVRNFFSSLGNHFPQPYFGKVTLFLSTEWYTEELSQFSQILQGEIELYEVPGYHDTLFVSPQIEVLGKQLKECLDQLNGSKDSLRVPRAGDISS